jgi:hypothetical protein
MKDHYDFSKGIKNPYAERLKQGYSVIIHYGPTEKNTEKKNPAPDNNPESSREQQQA